MTRILLADDQRDVLEALRILLKSEGYQTEAVTSLAAVFSALEKKDYTLLVMDLNYTRDTTSGQEGLAAMQRRSLQSVSDQAQVFPSLTWASYERSADCKQIKGEREEMG